MAVNETVGINLVADTKSLRSQLKEAVQELANLQNKAGASAKEIATAAKRAAELKDRIADAKSTIDAFNPDKKFAAFSQSIQGVAGAFAATQGALALFGVESENVQKQLLKVQAALALSEGLNTVLDSIQGFKNLGIVIRERVITAFTTLKGAIIATGIGALSIALAYLVANFEEVKNIIYKAIPGFKGLVDTVGTLVEKFTDFIGITSQAERAVDKLAKQTKNRNAELENEIKLLEASGSTSDKIGKKKKEQIDNEIKLIKEQGKVKGKLTDEELQKIQDLNTSKEILDAQAYVTKQKAEKAHQDELNKIRQQAEDEYYASQHSKYLDYEKQDKELYENRIEKAQSVKSITEKIAEQTAKNQAIRMDKLGKQIEKAGNKEVEITTLTQETKLQIISNALGSVANLVGRNTMAGKALSIVQATIDTYAGANKALAEYPPPFGAIAAATVVAGGLANVASIIDTEVPQYGDMGGISMPSVSTTVPVIPQAELQLPTRLDQTSLNTIQNVVSRAYVVESDISNTQSRIQRIQNAARF